MKKGTYIALALTAFLVVSGAAACTQQTATNSNTAMNHNHTTNSNSSTNMNGMNHNGMQMNGNHDMSQMNSNHDMSKMHDEMMKSDSNAASAPYDLQFIDTMTHHHQGAIMMAQMVLKKSQNEELKKFAQKIIDDQQKEINQMKEWRDKWFSGKPPAKNMEMPGMKDSMKMMSGDMTKMMDSMTGKDFDSHFLDMMIPHHQDAVTMSKDALRKAEHAEIKTLANQVIKEQEAEIKQMTDWKQKWAK
jgi:uncharacterized protein (DUF305 family)